MAVPTRDDAALMIQLAQWGTTLGIEDALAHVFAPDFDPQTADFMQDTAIRRILNYGESIGTLTKHGLLNAQLVHDWLWIAGIWERVGPVAKKAREAAGEPRLYLGQLRAQPLQVAQQRVQAVVARHPIGVEMGRPARQLPVNRPGRNPNHGCVRRDRVHDHCVRPDAGIVASGCSFLARLCLGCFPRVAAVEVEPDITARTSRAAKADLIPRDWVSVILADDVEQQPFREE